jgi:ubiquinone/menaquinone biosynthesis C-methylase UbiE
MRDADRDPDQMNHADHVRLISEGVDGGGPTWGDLGSGTGTFTLALADILGPTGTIWSVDRDASALRVQARALGARNPRPILHQLVADFTGRLDLPQLDGVVMANSLHFVRDKVPVLRLVRRYLRDGGRLVLVEYEADRGNRWVPYPLSFATWGDLAIAAGFVGTRRLHTVPSSFLGSIYAAVSLRGPAGLGP